MNHVGVVSKRRDQMTGYTTESRNTGSLILGSRERRVLGLHETVSLLESYRLENFSDNS